MCKLLLGIDLGTSSVKAGLFTQNLEVVSSATEKYPTTYPKPLWAEQDPNDWWRATVQVIRKIVTKVSVQDEIVGISVSSHSPVLLPLDEKGDPIRPAMIWMDRRAEKENTEIENEIVGPKRYREILGTEPDPYYVLPKLLWYQRNEPHNFKKTKIFLQCNGYINYRLTNSYSIDKIHAVSVQAMDIRKEEWSDEISGAMNIDFKKILPPIYQSYEIIGEITREAALETGLSKGIPVVAGATDSIAAFLAFDAYEPGQAAIMCGTSSIIFISTKQNHLEKGNLLLKPSPIKGVNDILLAPVSTTGASVNWFIENFYGIEKNILSKGKKSAYQTFDAEAEKIQAGCGGVIFHPYLSGERGPLWNTFARASFIGMDMTTTKAALYRSVLEGTSFAEKHIVEEGRELGNTIDSISLAGGASNSDIWTKIKASIQGVPIKILDDQDVDRASIGNAIIAGYGVGLFKDISKASKLAVKIKKIVEPIHEWNKTYDELYSLYRGFYTDMERNLYKLEDLSSRLKK